MNRVDLVGRLTRDPEPRRSSTGMTILKFSLAVRKTRVKPGERDADFFNCTAFGKTADNMARYLRKGSLISVEGRLQNDNYTNAQGQKVYAIDIIADNVQFLDSKGSGPANRYDSGSYDSDGYGQNDYDGGYGGGYRNSGYSAQADRNPYARPAEKSYQRPADGFASSDSDSDYPMPKAPDRFAKEPVRGNEGSAMAEDPFDDGDSLNIADDDLPF